MRSIEVSVREFLYQSSSDGRLHVLIQLLAKSKTFQILLIAYCFNARHNRVADYRLTVLVPSFELLKGEG